MSAGLQCLGSILLPYVTSPLSIRIEKPQSGLVHAQALYNTEAPSCPSSDSGISSPLLHFWHFGRSISAPPCAPFSIIRPPLKKSSRGNGLNQARVEDDCGATLQRA